MRQQGRKLFSKKEAGQSTSLFLNNILSDK